MARPGCCWRCAIWRLRPGQCARGTRARGRSMTDPFNDTHEMQTFGPIERDPNGIDPREPGAKLDVGKVEPELIQRGFARALLAVAEVGTYGAAKYTRDGWQDVQDGVRRYTNAMYRHLSAEHRGEERDPDTGLLHAAHAAWNALARLELMLREKEAEVREASHGGRRRG